MCQYLDHIREMFEVVRYSSSGPGSNAHMRETNAYMMFLDYLYECEKGKITTHTIIMYAKLPLYCQAQMYRMLGHGPPSPLTACTLYVHMYPLRLLLLTTL